MKILTLSINKLEIAKTQLLKPLMLIGRSPTCDVILRAPGIKAVHFIVEWLGSGEFDSETGNWSIVDVSAGEDSAEGSVLSTTPISIGDLSFKIIESSLESSALIGGRIMESLSKRRYSDPDLLEFVQVRTDSGAIEEIRHFPIEKKKLKVESLSKEFKSFKIEHPKMKSEALIKLLLSEMPGAELTLSGRKVNASDSVSLRSTDFMKVTWNGRDFYLRFVEEVTAPPIPRDFWGSPLLKRLTLIAALLALLLATLIHYQLISPEVEKVAEPPRIARVEIPAAPTPPPAPEPKVEAPKTPEQAPKSETKPEATPAPVKNKVEKPKVADVEIKNTRSNEPTKAAAPKVVTAPKEPVKSGLNVQAPVKSVNQIGLLGALSKAPAKGAGVKAEDLMNQAVVTETATGNETSRIVLKTPPTGVLGSGKSGSPKGSSNPGLTAASTTLSGISKADPSSNGLIARNGSAGGFKLGSADLAGGDTKGVGSLDGGDFSVAGGGLDRETVRRIINAYRSQIRTCYERALISSPNLEGRIVYKWQITPQGAVLSAQIFKTTLDSANLKTCVLEVIENMNFPKAQNGKPTTVIYPFVFQGKKQ